MIVTLVVVLPRFQYRFLDLSGYFGEIDSKRGQYPCIVCKSDRYHNRYGFASISIAVAGAEQEVVCGRVFGCCLVD